MRSWFRRRPPLMLAYLVSAALCWGAGVTLDRAGQLESTRLFWYDSMLQLRDSAGRSPTPHPAVVIVGIDDRSERAFLDRMPATFGRTAQLRRLITATLIALQEQEAAVVAIDYLFDQPFAADEQIDAQLVDAIAGSEAEDGPIGIDTVVAFHMADGRAKRAFAALRESALEGNIAVFADEADQIVRRHRPKLAPASLYGHDIPLFAIQAARLWASPVDDSGSRLGRLLPMRVEPDGALTLGDAYVIPPEFLIDFIGPAQALELRYARQFSAIDVIDGRVPPGQLRQALVFIGPAKRFEDRFAVPLTASDGALSQAARERFGLDDDIRLHELSLMNGIEIHANIAAQVLGNRYVRDFAGGRPGRLEWVSAALLLIAGWVFWRTDVGARNRPLVVGLGLNAAIFVGVVGLVVLISWRWFVDSATLITPVGLLVSWTAHATAGTVATVVLLRRDHRQIEQMYGTAVGEELLSYMKANPAVANESRRVEATVLFSDIRGFTPLTEQLGGDQVVALLREYFDAIVDPLAREGAWIDKFVGDLVMAAWNVVQPQPDHAARAVRAAVGMKLALAELNRRRTAAGQMPIRMGIGIHCGELVAGNVGSRQRNNFTLIGDTVNTASRIEHECRAGEILISSVLYDHVSELVRARPWGAVSLKGKSGTHTLYQVLGLADGVMVPPDSDASPVSGDGLPTMALAVVPVGSPAS